MEENKLNTFIDKLSLKQLDELQNRINIIKYHLGGTKQAQRPNYLLYNFLHRTSGSLVKSR